jgi:hypothetical protein
MDEELRLKVKNYIIETVQKYHGKKRFTPLELEKKTLEAFTDSNVDKRDIKVIMRDIIDAGDLIYGFAAGSFVTIPEDKENIK